MFNLSIDLYFSIFKYLSIGDICNLFKTCKHFNILKHKDKLWNYLFQYNYPHNLYYDNITMYQNYMYLIIIEKIIKDNWNQLYYTNIYYQGSKRNPGHAMTIPILLPNQDTIIISKSTKYALKRYGMYNDSIFEKDDSTLIISDCTKYALSKCNDNINMINYEYAVQYANNLLKTNKLSIVPKKGDLAVFIEINRNKNKQNQYKLIYNGKLFELCPISIPMIYRLGYIGLSWPEVPIDYWNNEAWFPKDIIEQFKNNMTVECVSFNVSRINKKIYSKATISNKTLYMFFYYDFTSVFEYDLYDIIEANSTYISDTHVLIREFGNKDGIEYIKLQEPDD